MSRTPADVPDAAPGPSAPELTEYERLEVARLAARDAGGVFVNPEQVGLLRHYLRQLDDAQDPTAEHSAAMSLAGAVTAVLVQAREL